MASRKRFCFLLVPAVVEYFSRVIRVCALLTPITLIGADTVYKAVSVDENGQLRIVVEGTKDILPAKVEDQVSFGSPAVSPDGRTVGWLVEYPDPLSPNRPISGTLVLFREGRVIHTFDTEQVFWDWQFQDRGKHVAYSEGPTHGGAADCVLVDTLSGKTIAKWWSAPRRKPPLWATRLRR